MFGLQAAPLGYQQITDLSAATPLVPPAGATYAMITAEAQDVRFRDDTAANTDPTATVGMPLAKGVALFYAGNLKAIRFIQQTAGAKLNILFYR